VIGVGFQAVVSPLIALKYALADSMVVPTQAKDSVTSIGKGFAALLTARK
jgi:hypothetical protein